MYVLDLLRKAAEIASGNAEKVDLKVDRLLSAVLEGLATSLPTSNEATLKEGAGVSRQALMTIAANHQMDPQSPNYVMGRIAAVTDLLGYSAAAMTSDAAVDLAKRHPYADILKKLADGPARNVDLAAHIDQSEEHVSRTLLKQMREHGLVVSQRRGREVYNAISPAGRLVVELGIQKSQRAPLEETNIHDFVARFSMRNLNPVEAIEGSKLPLLNAAAE